MTRKVGSAEPMSELSDALRAQRIEIAGEVHDRIIPPLFAARMKLEALAARIGEPVGGCGGKLSDTETADPSAAAEIRQAVELIQTAVSTSRQLLSELTPHQPGEEYWNSQLSRALGDSDCDLHQVGTIAWEQIDPEAAITLTSILEEAVRNAVRHAEPKRIELRIERVAESVPVSELQAGYRITIVDDGKGFDPKLATRHHGLHLMRLRAAALGGSLDVSSQPGGPTTITLWWPVSTSKPA